MKSSQESINASQVVNWLKLVYPKKYHICSWVNMYKVYNSFDIHICDIFEELDGVFLEIPGFSYRIAINSIVIDLKKGFSMGDRVAREVPSGPSKGIYYKYSLNFK